jgi:putative copper export protein
MAEWIEIAAKTSFSAAVIVAIGTLGATWLVSRSLDAAPSRLAARRRLDVLLLRASIVGLAALLVRAWAHTAVAFGLSEAWSFENLRVIALESRWGDGWRMQALAASSLTVIAVWARATTSRFARALAACVAVAACFAVPQLGHGASIRYGWLLHGVHVLAAGSWVGTLTVVSALRREQAGAIQALLLRAFAPLALAAILMLGASGAVASWVYLERVSDLWRTDYGRMLALKITLVACAGLLGGRNWYRLHRQNDRLMRPTVAAELVVMWAVIVVTGWLTELAHP